ncbi:hypothetical protein Ancab_025734 [Ancistrocladus abbreviatus]
MQSYIVYGVGYHNGGLCLKDRNLVESLFLGGDIQVLCTTNTLAHGINLPAHTVVIKSTQYFNKEKGLYMEYDRSTILQMCGRAGRPPFDDTGLNPESYAVKKGTPMDRIERHMHEICVKKVNELSSTQMIWTDEDGFLLKPLEPGRLMTKYYLKFDTMKHIMQSPLNCSLEDVLHVVSRAEELSWIQLRRNEKKLLNDINTDKAGRLRFHILGDKGKRKKRIQTREEKIFVLVNDCLTGDPSVHDLSLSQDTNAICSNGCRITKCMKEYFIHKKSYKGALNSILLAKSLHHKLWDDSSFLLKQLPGIGMVTAKALQNMGITSFDALAEADPRRVEIVTGRKYPFGNHIKESLNSLPPKVEMNIEVLESQRQGKPKLGITLTRLSQVQSVKRHYADVVVGLEEDNLIIYHEKLRVDEFSSPYSTAVLIPSTRQGQLTVKADLFYEEYIGIDLHQTLCITNNFNPDFTPKHGIKEAVPFPQAVESLIIEDGNANESHASVKKQGIADKFTMEIDSMPSFNLLEELEAVEGDDCKIITGEAIFDHIRKKSKDFLLLTAADAIRSPSSEAFKLTRKRIHEKQQEFHDVIEVSEEAERNRKLQKIIESPFSETKEPEPVGHPVKEYNKEAIVRPIITRSLDTINLVDDGGELPPQADNNRSGSRKEETIFDHIKRKFKNYRLIDKSVESKPIFPSKEQFSDNFLDLTSDASHARETMRLSEPVCNTVIISDSEPADRETDVSIAMEDMKENHHLSSRRSGICKSLDLPLEIFRNGHDLPSNDMAAPNRSSLNKVFQWQPRGTSVEHDGQNLHSWPSEPNGQSCSLTTATEGRKVDCFLGFKSVFSFL